MSWPLIGGGPLLSLRCSARVRHCLLLLVRVVDWCVSPPSPVRSFLLQEVFEGRWSAAFLPINHWRNCSEGVWWPCYIGSDIDSKIAFEKHHARFQEQLLKGLDLEEVLTSIPRYIASWEMLLWYCDARFGVLFCRVVLFGNGNYFLGFFSFALFPFFLIESPSCSLSLMVCPNWWVNCCWSWSAACLSSSFNKWENFMLNKSPDGGLSCASIVGNPCCVRVLFSSVLYVPGAIKLWIWAWRTAIVVLSSVFVWMRSVCVCFLFYSSIAFCATVFATWAYVWFCFQYLLFKTLTRHCLLFLDVHYQMPRFCSRR